MKPEHRQLALKSLVWRLVSLVSTLAITALVTGSLAVGGLVAALDGLVTMIVLYPAFELWWERRKPNGKIILSSPHNPRSSSGTAFPEKARKSARDSVQSALRKFS